MIKDRQYYKFCSYGFLKNLRFFDAFLLLFLLEKGVTYTQIGLLYGIREVIVNLLELPSGIVADTYGRKNALAGSFLAYIFSFVLFYGFHHFWWFVLAFVLYGTGDAFRSGTHKGMIMDYLRQNGWEDKKIWYYGHTRSWSQMGSAISSLVAGIIVFYSGQYERIFLYSVFPYFINFVLILSYPESINYASKQKKRQSLQQTFHAFFSTIRQKNVFNIAFSSAFFSAYLKSIKDYIQLIMANVALLIPFLMGQAPENKSGVVIGLLYFGLYLLTSRASKFASVFEGYSKRNLPTLTLYAGLGMGALSGVFYIRGWWIPALLAFIGIYILENIRKPILTGYISDNVPNEVLTSVISAQSLLRTIITAVIALAVGVIADYQGMGMGLLSVSLLLIVVVLFFNTK